MDVTLMQVLLKEACCLSFFWFAASSSFLLFCARLSRFNVFMAFFRPLPKPSTLIQFLLHVLFVYRDLQVLRHIVHVDAAHKE